MFNFGPQPSKNVTLEPNRPQTLKKCFNSSLLRVKHCMQSLFCSLSIEENLCYRTLHRFWQAKIAYGGLF